jgi:hypothetical protein
LPPVAVVVVVVVAVVVAHHAVRCAVITVNGVKRCASVISSFRNESLKSGQNGEMDFWEVGTYKGENQ